MGIFLSVLCHLLMVVSTASNCNFFFAFFCWFYFWGKIEITTQAVWIDASTTFQVVHKRTYVHDGWYRQLFFMENDCLIGFLNIVQCRIQERPTLPLPLFLDQTEARRSKKKLFETEPTLISGSGWRYTGRFVKKGGFGPIGCLPFTCSANWSVHGLGKGKAKFRTGKFRPGIAFAPAPVPVPAPIT